MPSGGIVVLDYGSQYTQLIARRIRSMDVFSQVLRCDAPESDVLENRPRGIILSGGPSSVFEQDANAGLGTGGAHRLDNSLGRSASIADTDRSAHGNGTPPSHPDMRGI